MILFRVFQDRTTVNKSWLFFVGNEAGGTIFSSVKWGFLCTGLYVKWGLTVFEKWMHESIFTDLQTYISIHTELAFMLYARPTVTRWSYSVQQKPHLLRTPTKHFQSKGICQCVYCIPQLAGLFCMISTCAGTVICKWGRSFWNSGSNFERVIDFPLPRCLKKSVTDPKRQGSVRA